MKRLFTCALLLPFFTACDNDTEIKPPVNPDPVIPVTINYSSKEAIISETTGTHAVTIQFSAPAPIVGGIEITFESEHAVYGEHFTTEPASQNGKISLVIDKGQTEASFVVRPINNAKLHNHKTLTFSIGNATGGVATGEVQYYDLIIEDAQLVNKLHTITVPGVFFSKKTFEYTEDGQIAKIYWETKAPLGPGNVTGTDIYHYDTNGQLTHIVRGTFTYNYIREEGKLVRHETVSNNSIVNYTLYEYDENNKLIRQDIFVHQGDGKYAYSFTDYEYDEQGNLYQDKRYSVFNDEPIVFSTTTYTEYAEGYDPSPIIELTSVQESSLKVPVRYSVKSYEETPKEYTVEYDLRADGYPIERRVNGPNGVQNTVFAYY